MSIFSAPCDGIAGARGARPLDEADAVVDAFEPGQSAALFVGVRRFPYDKTLTEVRYAVDDAVDLACVVALDGRVRLVDPARVVLALSGEPQKTESQRNLARLVAAGARVRSAGAPDILTALDEQASAAGRKGLLIVAFATHGFSRDGTQYLLTATSILRHERETISENEVRDIAAQSAASRSLLLIDACRERLTGDRRGTAPDARSAAALLRAMQDVRGQVVLSAAAAGEYAYDDDERRNGVFTAAVMDGLRCEAAADERGLITADKLASFVEQRVLIWIRKHANSRVKRATQLSFEGSARSMPLAQCRRTEDAPEPVPMPQAPEERPLFSDGFFDNRHNWYLSTDPDAPAGLEDGIYFLGSKAFEWRFSSVPVPIDQAADFQISVSARRLRGETNPAFGLVWGLSNGSNLFFFAINAEGHVVIAMMEKGQVMQFNEAGLVNPNVRLDSAANHLLIEKRGNRLRFLINGGVVHEMDFRPFFGPGVGFAAFHGPVVAAFDDLRIDGGK